MKYLIVLFLLSLQALITKATYDLGYKQGRLDELEENLKMMSEALFVNKEPQDPFGDGE